MRRVKCEDANVVGVSLSCLDSGADGGEGRWIRILHLLLNSLDFGRRHRRHALLHALHSRRRNIAHLILYLRQLSATTTPSEATETLLSWYTCSGVMRLYKSKSERRRVQAEVDHLFHCEFLKTSVHCDDARSNSIRSQMLLGLSSDIRVRWANNEGVFIETASLITRTYLIWSALCIVFSTGGIKHTKLLTNARTVL